MTGRSASARCSPRSASAPPASSRCRGTSRGSASRVEFGATDIVAERGDEGIARIKELFDGIGPDAVLECVGTKESMDQAIRSVRPGGVVGYVGVPNGGAELPIRTMFNSNVGVRGGVAPVRNYVEELLPEVLDGRIQPGRVFDLELPLSRGRGGVRRDGRAPRDQGPPAPLTPHAQRPPGAHPPSLQQHGVSSPARNGGCRRGWGGPG